MKSSHCLPFLLCALAAFGCSPDDAAESVAGAPSFSAAGAGKDGTLNSPAQTVLWAGTVLRDAAAGGGVPECAAVPCDRFDLTLSLPGGVWNNKPGGMQVALR